MKMVYLIENQIIIKKYNQIIIKKIQSTYN